MMQTAAHLPAQSPGSGSLPYPPLPASPTLTNPDMILPDYDDTPHSPESSRSVREMWKNAHVGAMQFDLSSQAFSNAPVLPTTPIIYGNGTMLSDIGEVTEVESTCAARSRSGSNRKNLSLKASPGMTYEAIRAEGAKIARERERDRENGRRLSTDSNSTITTLERTNVFADFDDVVSVEDTNFQGDDEESMADSYIDDTSVQESISPAREFPPAGLEDRYSTALSRRAEQILATAKRRLTTMEGNLSRARSTLHSPTLSSVGSDSAVSPTMFRPLTAVPRDHDNDFRRHSRISSENNVPAAPKSNSYAQRSSSALGAAGGYRQPLQESHNTNTMYESPKISPKHNPVLGNAAFAKSKTSLNMKEPILEPLSEDEVSEEFGNSRPSWEDARLDGFLSPTFGSAPVKGLRRSASTAQMRDLKDHMKDLKGRLSTLRDQARADTLRRRSLQSLRTPSPFTHSRVEQWYAETKAHNDESTGRTTPLSHPLNGDAAAAETHDPDAVVEQGIPEADEGSDGSHYRDAGEAPLTTRSAPAGAILSPEDNIPVSTDPADLQAKDVGIEDGFDGDEDANAAYDIESESGESSYHDTVQVQLSHEDRDDAFDYEHFFLHSAMGSIGQKRMLKRDSQDSYDSEDSAETTRGPAVPDRMNSLSSRTTRRSRRGSGASTSTMDSFETATEGRSTRTGYETVDGYPEKLIAQRAARISRLSDSSSSESRLQASVLRRPHSNVGPSGHRPSVSSFESNGSTNRSFPLVNKPKTNGGVLTPRDSPDRELHRISETFSLLERDEKSAPIRSLAREDQLLVEKLVASLGRCVLRLTEAGTADQDSEQYRRRIDAARRLLDGVVGTV